MKNIKWSNLYRAAVWAVVGIAMFTIWSDAPEAEDTPGAASRGYAILMDTASSDNEANNTRTQGAPQQQVVNGWHSNDLLTIQGLQNNSILDALERQNQALRTLTSLLVAFGLGVAADLIGTSLLGLRSLSPHAAPEHESALTYPPAPAPLIREDAPPPPAHL